jgi:serine/threonine protein kinase/formylglycine-generating enzyme required for sulfatase activity
MTEREIFQAVLDLPDAAARAEYLDKVCGGDPPRRARIEALLLSHDNAGSFLGTPAAAMPEIDRTETMAYVAGNPNSGEEPDGLEFLAPSQRPGSLGRIGHYEVLQVLGHGGFGIVFRAFDDILQRVVAIKVMAPQMAATSPARRRFLREAQSSAKVRHENVVQVYEVGEQPLPYLAMEFIPGETLQQKLDRSGPLDVPEILRIGRQIAEGLAAAHACDLIHRDIKPGNVLLEGGSYKAKITDFGLARAADDASLSQSGVIAGTPMFMAPEQALGQHIDQRADLFSLGSVLYQMTSGRPPFRAPSALAVLKRVAEEPPRPIPEIIPETPDWLCGIIAKLHAKNPDHRFQSAREVADLLADCEAKLKAKLEVKNVLPASPSAAKPAKRRWVAAAAVLLLPVLALVVTEFAGVTHLLRKQQPTVAATPIADPEVTPKSDPKIESKTPLAGRFALTFDGNKSVVRIPSLRISEDQALTVEAWTVVEDRVDRDKGIDLLANSGGSQGFTLGIPPAGYGAHGGEQWAFAVALKSPKIYVQAWEKQPLPQNQLIHVAGVYDGKAEIRFYVNGQLQSRTPAPDVKPSTYSMMRLGANHESKNGFLGRMNEVRISKVARYDTDFTPVKRWEPDTDTLAVYHFDEGEGIVLKDSSGNGHHGEIVGAKWVKADGSPLGSPPSVTPGPLPPTFKNSIGMEFVIVPKGKSWLGGGKDKLGDQEVVIPADFYLGRYAVTQEEWTQVMGENPSHFSRTGGGTDAVKDITDADLKRFPVEMVSWDQCQIFVAKLNSREKETGWVYRLPKDVEWEYACRGGPMADKADSAFDFYFAKPTNTLLPEQANFDMGLNRMCKVGSYEPNVLGLYDMHGNVWEWCESPFGPKNPTMKAARGGCWDNAAAKCRAASRLGSTPGGRFKSLGLRLARVSSAAPSPEAKSPVMIPLPAPTIHDTWLKAIALLPLDQNAAALPAKLKEKLPEFDDAFLRAIPRMSADRQVVMVDAWLKERKPAFEGFEDAWLKLIPSMAGDAQAVLAAAWLRERNPGFEGEVTNTIEGGVLTRLEATSPLVQDLTPLWTLTGLRTFTGRGTLGYDKHAERDATVLRSLKLLETINGKATKRGSLRSSAAAVAERCPTSFFHISVFVKRS